ncbi:Cytochrome c-552 precursor [Thalassoglobus neptunius]|uniref:nitrite reductase (cytochrome; ammonia-forming) n=1 Tax=Thalassoglobus neptunius TaxID=1938619 RepID=A0A5C5V8R0_9PLAN|nr:ammonia-forming cytochrome c nitrite reductase subunit c552 [Thalassoglobus neptunius]TWT34984.1 Cytochrome c-552 precursor [Thalassoglobus neptunius]
MHPRAGVSKVGMLVGLILLVALTTFAVTGVLVTIFERQQEARTPFVRLVEVDEITTDPAPWGVNWPNQYDTYLQSVDTEESEYGGSSAMTTSKLETYPWLKRLYAGYAFSLDYREARGHAYMLYDQEVTKRVTERPQGGACLHCHASIIPTYRRLGMESFGEEVNEETLAQDFNWDAVVEGFVLVSKMDYPSAHKEVLRTPDGSTGEQKSPFPGGTSEVKTSSDESSSESEEAEDPHLGHAHPVSCIDCHDPQSMEIRVTRPGFVMGIQSLAESDEPVHHLPSITRWREGSRAEKYDPNKLASRQEMRSSVCGQCHVEYYCATKETLFFPWENGLKAEQIEQTFDEHLFPDGTEFYDYKHGETGAKIYKAQHPEFELWSQGIHARSGVSCSDCHMPYERKGAMKVSSHLVQSPMLNINNSCQVCHNVPEAELKARVETIQNRTKSLMLRAADAMTAMLDAIRDAEAAGATEEQLKPILDLQRKGMWRLDFISSENSKGFHADQEAARLLGESIDYCRQAEVMALKLRAADAPESQKEITPIEGVTPADEAPAGAE